MREQTDDEVSTVKTWLTTGGNELPPAERSICHVLLSKKNRRMRTPYAFYILARALNTSALQQGRVERCSPILAPVAAHRFTRGLGGHLSIAV